MFQLFIYRDGRGRARFGEWLDGLVDETALRVLARVGRLEDGNFGDRKGVGGGVQELRLSFGPGYRVYFGVADERIVLLLQGGDKRRQSDDIALARRLWAEYNLGLGAKEPL